MHGEYQQPLHAQQWLRVALIRHLLGAASTPMRLDGLPRGTRTHLSRKVERAPQEEKQLAAAHGLNQRFGHLWLRQHKGLHLLLRPSQAAPFG